MNFDVPQYIDVEDKIAFQLTAKQLGWFGLGGVGMFLAWNYASQGMFIVWAVLIVVVCIAFAFFKPYGITLSAFIGYGFLFVFRPKKLIWQRSVNVNPADLEQKKEEKKEIKPVKKLEGVENLADVLDKNRYIR